MLEVATENHVSARVEAGRSLDLKEPHRVVHA
jgi:hypothetical protein